MKPAAGGFSPSDISGLIRWYKADAITGYSNGDGLSNWVDSTGTFTTDYTFFPFAAAPTYQTSIAGSLPGVLFTNSCGLGMGKPVVNTNKSFTFFIAYKKSDMGVTAAICDWQSDTATMTFRHLARVRDDANNDILVQPRPSATLFLSGDPSGTHQFMVQGSQTAGFAGSLDQGTEQTDVANLMANDSSAASTIGCNINLDSFFTGYIYEILFYDSVLSAGNKTSVGNYLKTKWGTP